MLYTLKQYSELFMIGNKKVSAKTIERRLLKGMMPSTHRLVKLPGRTGARLIEVIDDLSKHRLKQMLH